MRKTRAGRPVGPGFRPGVTLVELMVVILISVIVVAVAFTLFRVNVTYYLKEDARLEQDQNLRVALSTIARDVRMAGNGYALLGAPNRLQFVQAWVPSQERLDGSGRAIQTGPAGWFSHADTAAESAIAAPDQLGARAIFGVDGGKDGPDTLTIFRAEVESGAPLGHLRSPYDFSDGRLFFNENFQEGVVREKDILVLVNDDRAVLAEVWAVPAAAPMNYVDINRGGRFTPPDSGAFDFPAGADVYNLRDVVFVTYFLDEENRQLMADYHDLDENGRPLGPVVVAVNIEDFQVYYCFNDEVVNFEPGLDPDSVIDLSIDPVINSDKLDVRNAGGVDRINRVKAVVLGLMARAGEGRDDRSAQPRPRPAFFNRAEGTEADRFTRNILTEIIYLRNY